MIAAPPPLRKPGPASQSLAILFGVAALLGITASGGGAQVPENPDGPRFEVFLLTVDQGDAVWEKFGHNALLIRNLTTGQEIAWNWGLFDFGAEDFIPRFLRGSMLYSMGPMDPGALVASYVEANRSVYSNRILLTDPEAEALDRLVWTNFEPENRDYRYHYFRDNCSTRVRDALDSVLGGLLQETFADRETPNSYRWHTRRLVRETTWIDQGLSFLLGTRGDIPRTEWDAMFVPMELMTLLEGVERMDETGMARPLLGPREVRFQSTRPPTPSGPPPLSPVWPTIGVAYAAILLWLGSRGARGRPAALRGLALGTAAWGLFSACFGGILVAVWFTDHDFIHWNLNLLYVSPAGVLLAPAALAALLSEARGGRRARTVATRIALAIALVAVVAALAEATPFLGQGNGEVLAVALPIDLAVAWAFGRTVRPRANDERSAA